MKITKLHKKTKTNNRKEDRQVTTKGQERKWRKKEKKTKTKNNRQRTKIE